MMGLVLMFSILNSLEIISPKAESIELNLAKLNNLPLQTFTTTRDKKGKISTDEWQGYSLSEILHIYNIDKYDLLEINSIDNYQVKLTSQMITENHPILAIKRNNSVLDSTQLRIVSASLRDMYWASNIKNIKCISQTIYPDLKKVFAFSEASAQIRLIENPEPFTNVKGYKFSDLISQYSLIPYLPIKIISQDNLSQELDYQSFLEKAVLILNSDGSLDIKSPSMPGGMWQKNIKCLIIDDVMIYFNQKKEAFNDKEFKVFASLKADSKLKITFNKTSNNPKSTNWANITSIEIN